MAGRSSPVATSPDKPDLQQLSREAFTKVGEYLNGELQGSVEEYVMLEKMNKVTATRYAEMKDLVAGASESLLDLKAKYDAVGQYSKQIDEIEEAVTELEQAAYRLDAYSKQLEAKYKELEKR